MVSRINFIEKEPFALTYQKMVVVGVLLLGLGMITMGLQSFYLHIRGKQVEHLKQEIAELKTQQEKILRELQAQGKEKKDARATLIRLFEESITWSSLFRNLTVETPSALWFTSVKSFEKEDLPAKRGLTVSGVSEEASLVARFLKSLSDSQTFEKVVLTSLRQETGEGGERYSFSIDLVVSSQVPSFSGKRGAL